MDALLKARLQATANELERRRREQWIKDIEAFLIAIDPGLATGHLSAGGLPPNAVINRSAYNSATSYRAGDLVVSAGGTYIALVGNTGVALSHTDTWLQIAGGMSIPPPPDTFVYLVDDDGAYIVDDDGAYLWEPV
jgi:hypothetical protein